MKEYNNYNNNKIICKATSNFFFTAFPKREATEGSITHQFSTIHWPSLRPLRDIRVLGFQSSLITH